MQKPFAIAIFDDTQAELENTDRLIWEYCRGRGISLEVYRYSDQTEFLASIATCYFGAVFVTVLDMGGLEMAFRVRDHDKDCPLIVISDSGEFALAAYRLQAAQYLVKPLDSEKIATSMANAIKHGIANYQNG